MSQQDYFYSSINNLSFELIQESQAFSPERFDIFKGAQSFDQHGILPSRASRFNAVELQ
jgi:hypothetical protein